MRPFCGVEFIVAELIGRRFVGVCGVFGGDEAVVGVCARGHDRDET